MRFTSFFGGRNIGDGRRPDSRSGISRAPAWKCTPEKLREAEYGQKLKSRMPDELNCEERAYGDDGQDSEGLHGEPVL